MKNEPEIVKQLKEEERLGRLKYDIKNNIILEKKPQNEENNITVLENGFKKVKNEFYIKDIEQKYQSIFENYAIAITIADEKERIVSWNKYAEELLEMTEKDLALQPVSCLYPAEEWKKIRDENIRKKGMKFKLEKNMIKKNKGTCDVEI